MAIKLLNRRKIRAQKRKRVRKKIVGSTEVPRLAVFRSLKHMYAQLIDDSSQKTILTVSSLSKDLSDEISKAKNKTEVAKIVGQNIAKKAVDMKYNVVKFDRSGYLYHGVVKSLAEGAREGGLKF